MNQGTLTDEELDALQEVTCSHYFHETRWHRRVGHKLGEMVRWHRGRFARYRGPTIRVLRGRSPRTAGQFTSAIGATRRFPWST